MSENQVLRQVWLALGMLSRLFRLNSGQGWVTTRGKPHRLSQRVFLDSGVVLEIGDVVVPGGRPVSLGFGAPNGDPVSGPGDLIGWTTITITQPMVGCDVAVFTDIETKSSSDAHKRKAQHSFIDQVTKAGGIAGFAHTPEMARKIVTDFLPPRKTSE